MDKQQLSKDILKLVGGEENIDQVTHCMTRLRFNLNDNQKADKATLKKYTRRYGRYGERWTVSSYHR
ncbi:glucose-like phosphotransferase system IIB component [Paenibacillus sp. W4I10]|nr:glucose-like phosphotransferase system IIB component [Paenibacillus sp. W4I10]